MGRGGRHVCVIASLNAVQKKGERERQREVGRDRERYPSGYGLD